MNIGIDVENASGTRYGAGPITTASEWQSTRRLDAAGTFSFVMPAADPRSNLLAHKRFVRCWGADADGIREVGAGIIDTIEVVPGSPSMLRVSGDDLLRELANRTVGDLELFQEVTYSTTHATAPLTLRLTEGAAWRNLVLPETVNMEIDPVSFLEFKYPRQFSKITLRLSSMQTALTDAFQVQYYNAQDPTRPDWWALGGLVNNTASPGPGNAFYPFRRSGTIEFDAPAGWSSLGGEYIVRMFDQQTDLTPFTIEEASISIVEPVSDGLARIMAMAPDGWSLDPAGHYATQTPVYMQFSGESVLTALVMLAEQTGEHFLLSPSARRVWWIGKDQEASGLRAVQAEEPIDETMLITGLSRTSDSYDLCTRIYAHGGGVGSGRLSMEYTSRSEPGYTLGPAGAYLEADAALATYGRIDSREDYPDIAPTDVSTTQVQNAANTLYDRVFNRLRKLCELQYAFSLTVVPGKYLVWPGQTIVVDYHEWVEGFHAVDISEELWVLEVSQTITESGVQTVSFTVATIDYMPVTDSRAIARMMGDVQTTRSVDIPATGYSNNARGVPVTLDVLNGQVVALGRVIPIANGVYSPVDTLLIHNGIILAVNP